MATRRPFCFLGTWFEVIERKFVRWPDNRKGFDVTDSKILKRWLNGLAMWKGRRVEGFLLAVINP